MTDKATVLCCCNLRKVTLNSLERLELAECLHIVVSFLSICAE